MIDERLVSVEERLAIAGTELLEANNGLIKLGEKKQQIEAQLGVFWAQHSNDQELLKSLKGQHRRIGQEQLEYHEKVGHIRERVRQLENELRLQRKTPAVYTGQKFEVTSPDISDLKRKGIISEVILEDLEPKPITGRSVAAYFDPDAKRITLYSMQSDCILDDRCFFPANFAHERDHAITLAKPPRFIRTKKGLRSYPFLFLVAAKEDFGKKFVGYELFQHASEVTAYRASGKEASKFGQAGMMHQELRKSNEAIERNLVAIQGARETLKKSRNIREFVFGYIQGPYSHVRYKIPINNSDGVATHEFILKVLIPIDEDAIISWQEFVDYLDYLEHVHLKLRSANQKTLNLTQSVK